MKILGLLLFLLISPNLFAQDLPKLRPTANISLVGVWNRVKVEMKDGSKAIDNTGELTADMILAFDAQNLVKTVTAQTENKLSYSVDNGILFFGNQETFKIDKPSDNELIITAINYDLPDYKLSKSYFVRSSMKLEDLINQKFVYPNMRPSIDDTLFKMTRFVYPKLRAIDKDFTQAYGFAFASIEERFRPNFNKTNKFRVRFTVTKRGKVENLWIDQSSDARLNDRLADAILAYDGRWLPATFNGRAVTTEVRYEFGYGNNLQAEDPQTKKESAEAYFARGIDYYKQNRFTEAIQNFDLCLGLDPQNVQALFNKGASLMNLKQKDEACKTWNYLYKDLGQVWVEKYIKQYCGAGVGK